MKNCFGWKLRLKIKGLPNVHGIVIFITTHDKIFEQFCSVYGIFMYYILYSNNNSQNMLESALSQLSGRLCEQFQLPCRLRHSISGNNSTYNLDKNSNILSMRPIYDKHIFKLCIKGIFIIYSHKHLTLELCIWLHLTYLFPMLVS